MSRGFRRKFEGGAADVATTFFHAGAQAYAADTANNFSGNSTAFAAATARFSVVRDCLYNATIAASAEASASASAASTAIAQANVTSASQAITGAICNPVTATATAQAFAQAIATAQGCNGVIYEAISSEYICQSCVACTLSNSCCPNSVKLVLPAFCQTHVACILSNSCCLHSVLFQ